MILTLSLLASMIISGLLGLAGYKTKGFRQLPGMKRKALGSSLKSSNLFPADLVGGVDHPIYNVSNPYDVTKEHRKYFAWHEKIDDYRAFRRYKLYARIRTVYLATKSVEVKSKAEILFKNQLLEADAIFKRTYDMNTKLAQDNLQKHLDLIEQNVVALETGELKAITIESNTFESYIKTTIEGTIVPSELDLTGITYQSLAKAFKPQAIEAAKKLSEEDQELLEHYQSILKTALSKERYHKEHNMPAHAAEDVKFAHDARYQIDLIRKRAK
jgi:hypothetical protein